MISAWFRERALRSSLAQNPGDATGWASCLQQIEVDILPPSDRQNIYTDVARNGELTIAYRYLPIKGDYTNIT